MYVEMLCIFIIKKKRKRKIRIYFLNLKNIKNNMVIWNKKIFFLLFLIFVMIMYRLLGMCYILLILMKLYMYLKYD